MDIFNLIKKFYSCLLLIFGFFLGSSFSRARENKRIVKDIKIVRKIEDENNKLNRDELIDKL